MTKSKKKINIPIRSYKLPRENLSKLHLDDNQDPHLKNKLSELIDKSGALDHMNDPTNIGDLLRYFQSSGLKCSCYMDKLQSDNRTDKPHMVYYDPKQDKKVYITYLYKSKKILAADPE